MKSITDKNFGIKPKKFDENMRERVAVRTVLINGDKIAIFNKSLKKEYKIPGGGVEKDEDLKTALLRESLEETGCKIKIIKKMGIINEYLSQDNFKKVSHVYISKVVEDTHKLDLTKKEIAEGGRLLWVKPIEALDYMKKSYDSLVPSKYENLYHTRFIAKREQSILEYFIDNFMNKYMI